jgi:hypothetical protein
MTAGDHWRSSDDFWSASDDFWRLLVTSDDCLAYLNNKQTIFWKNQCESVLISD